MEAEGICDPASADGRAALGALLTRATGTAAEVAGAVSLSGGASSATWRLDLADGGRLILQRTMSDEHGGLPRSAQGELMRRASMMGVPAPPVVAVPDPADGLGDAIVTAFVEGEALAPRWLRDPAWARARGALVGQCAQALARLHAAPVETWADLPLAGGSGADLLATMFALYRRLGVAVPAFDLAFAWLRPRMPAEPAQCLVHGDFRSGNFLVDRTGLAAVLDWELAHLSVPEEDLGWLCVQAWRFGQWQQPVGGFGTREELLAAYAAAGGKPLSRESLHTWEVFGTLRWGMSCLQLADDHVSGRLPSVERAAIGRRATEVAADLVHLMIHGEV